MVPREQLHRVGNVRTTIMIMMITLVMEMMITLVMMINTMLMTTSAATRIVTTMMRMAVHAKLAGIVVAMPGATDEQVSAFVEAEPTAVFPNAAEYLARHGERAPVMVRRDDVYNKI